MNYIDRLAHQIRSHVSASKIPSEDTDALFRMYAVLLLAKGEHVETEDVHNAWAAWMAGRQGEHDALVPFDQLPESKIAEDLPYLRAIRQVAGSRAGRALK